ncbi:MAG: hypothetical protein KY437_09400 [Actinobacteria bacterium]|nr:hypothetical protein [Actinomycetota bacterium]
MSAIEELRKTGVSGDLLDHVADETLLYARGQGEVATLLTSRGHLYRVRGDQVELTVLRPAVQIRVRDSAISIRAAHGVEAMLFESDPERRNALFRRLVETLV